MSSTAVGMGSVCAASRARTSPRGRRWFRTGLSTMQKQPPESIDARRRGLLGLGASAVCLASVSPLVNAASGPVVRTTHGRVRGMRDGDLQVFRGIRYGADTTPRRFMPPIAPLPWRGVVDATAFGAASAQPGPEPNQSEDCLFLNVTAPLAKSAHP